MRLGGTKRPRASSVLVLGDVLVGRGEPHGGLVEGRGSLVRSDMITPCLLVDEIRSKAAGTRTIGLEALK
jgi:hypothetical protein